MEMGFSEAEIAESRIAYITEQLERSELAADVYQEAYSQAVQQMLRAEDIGWEALSHHGDFTVNLRDAQMVSEKLGEWTKTNPLLKQGLQARNAYLFNAPYEIGVDDAKSALSSTKRNLFLREDNQNAVFSLSALEAIEYERYTAGTAFVLFDKDTKKFQRIPFDEISDIIYDPLNRDVIRYVQRTVTYSDINPGDGMPIPRKYEAWYPCTDYDGDIVGRIGGVKVETNKRIIVSRANRRTGDVLGTPDAFAAAPWALAYSAYLRDGTKVLAALAEWVWKITPKKKTAAEKAAAKVRTERGAGGSLFTDMDVQALPRADAVDLTTGRPLAAQAASALGISVVVLLADPGQSGAYGVAQTLADPNRRVMQARRELNTEFLKECLRLLGIDNPAVTWAKMAPGTDREEVQLLSQLWGTGLFHEDEIRPVMAKVGQITLNHEAPPEGFLVPNNEHSVARSDIDADVKLSGANSQANGVGQDNLGMGATSRIRSDGDQSGADSSE